MNVSKIKAEARKRDGYRCTECGLSEEQHRNVCGKGLEVHRIKPGTPYQLETVTTLCGACHSTKPRSASGRSDRISFHLPRRLFLEALGLESLDGVSGNKFLISLLRSLPRELPRTVLEELQKARKETPYAIVKIEKHLAVKAKFIATCRGISVTEYLSEILGPLLSADYKDLRQQIVRDSD